MATNNVDFATWNFTNVQLAPVKLKLVDSQAWVIITANLAAETAARIAADAAEAVIRGNADLALQSQIDDLGESYAHSMLLGGM